MSDLYDVVEDAGYESEGVVYEFCQRISSSRVAEMKEDWEEEFGLCDLSEINVHISKIGSGDKAWYLDSIIKP